MARGQYKGSKIAAVELKRRKMESHFIDLASRIKDEPQLIHILNQYPKEMRPLMLQLVAPHLKFEIESEHTAA